MSVGLAFSMSCLVYTKKRKFVRRLFVVVWVIFVGRATARIPMYQSSPAFSNCVRQFPSAKVWRAGENTPASLCRFVQALLCRQRWVQTGNTICRQAWFQLINAAQLVSQACCQMDINHGETHHVHMLDQSH